MREDLISRRKVLLLAGLATGLAVSAAAMLTASAAEAQQDTMTPGAETAPKKKKQTKAKAQPKAAPSSTAPPSTQPKTQ